LSLAPPHNGVVRILLAHCCQHINTLTVLFHILSARLGHITRLLPHLADNVTHTQLLLVTEYHERGSLFDHLNATVLSEQDMVNICSSIASGLAHIHMELLGSQGTLP